MELSGHWEQTAAEPLPAGIFAKYPAWHSTKWKPNLKKLIFIYRSFSLLSNNIKEVDYITEWWRFLFYIFSDIWVFHDRPFRHISVRLSDRSKVTQNKINFIKNCPLWGLNSQPPDHQSHALPTELARNLLEMSEVSFLLFHASLHMLDFVYF